MRALLKSRRLRGRATAVDYVVLVLLGVLWSGLAAPPARSDTLDDALVQAYNASPSLRAKQAELRATDELVPEALATSRPSIIARGGEGIAHEDNRQDCNKTAVISCPNAAGQGTNPVTSRNLSPQYYGLAIDQPLYNGGLTWARNREAMSQIRAERASLVDTEQTVLLAAVTAYVDYLTAKDKYDLQVKNEADLRQHLASVEARFNAGALTQTDEAQARAALAQAVATKDVAAGDFDRGRAEYRRAIGSEPGDLVAVGFHPPLPASRDEAVAQAVADYPTVVGAAYTLEAAEDDVRVVRADLLPKWTLDAQIGRNKEYGNADRAGYQRDAMSLITNLTVPIFDTGVTYARSRAAQHTATQRHDELDQTRRLAEERAASSWDSLVTIRSSLVSLTEAVKASRISLDGVEIEAKLGARTELDVLNAKQALLTAERALIDGQHDAALAEFTLTNACGRLTARGLDLPVDTYDPDLNFEHDRHKWWGFGTIDEAPPASGPSSPGIDRTPHDPLMNVAAAHVVPKMELPPLAANDRAATIPELPTAPVSEAAVAEIDALPVWQSEAAAPAVSPERAKARAADRKKWMEFGSDE